MTNAIATQSNTYVFDFTLYSPALGASSKTQI